MLEEALLLLLGCGRRDLYRIPKPSVVYCINVEINSPNSTLSCIVPSRGNSKQLPKLHCSSVQTPHLRLTAYRGLHLVHFLPFFNPSYPSFLRIQTSSPSPLPSLVSTS